MPMENDIYTGVSDGNVSVMLRLDDLQDILDRIMTWESDPDKNEDAYYEWQDWINALNDLIDAIDLQIKKSLHQQTLFS